jgi:hypothetical protein
VLYAGTAGAGVFLSSTSGASWTAMNPGLTKLDVAGLLLDPVGPGTLYAATLGQGVFDFDFDLATFADVLSGHPFFAWIEALVAAGITGGCATSPPRYCPDAAATRGQMAVFLLRSIAFPGAASPPAPTGTVFADVPVTHPFAGWIEGLAAAGITGGCGGGNYCPNSPVTRGQMAVFLLRARHGPGFVPPAPAQQTFGDVPLSHPFAAWIYQLAAEGITGGCGGGNYCPEAAVTRGQMAVFLVRTFNLPM